jgi:hypothetical protein
VADSLFRFARALEATNKSGAEEVLQRALITARWATELDRKSADGWALVGRIELARAERLGEGRAHECRAAWEALNKALHLNGASASIRELLSKAQGCMEAGRSPSLGSSDRPGGRDGNRAFLLRPDAGSAGSQTRPWSPSTSTPFYREVIKPAIVGAGLEPFRADEELSGGIIHKAMFERLILCDYAVADLTLANANVFYELGVRHAARPWSTVSIYAGSSRLPFDVADLRTIHYSIGPEGLPDRVDEPRHAITGC